MADRIMARPLPPASPTTSAQSAQDVLENRLSQLESLLWCCHAAGNQWDEDAEQVHLSNVLWLAAELASEAVALHQECLLTESSRE